MTVNATLTERGKRYGEFKDHARIAQGIKSVMRASPNWAILEDDQREALEMIAHKCARVLNGDPDWSDSWHDIAGYAVLVEERLNQTKDEPSFSYPPPLCGDCDD